MALKAPTDQTRDSQADLADAFNVHAALVSIESKRPQLRNNPRWKLIRFDAYEAFWRAMQGEG